MTVECIILNNLSKMVDIPWDVEGLSITTKIDIKILRKSILKLVKLGILEYTVVYTYLGKEETVSISEDVHITNKYHSNNINIDVLCGQSEESVANESDTTLTTGLTDRMVEYTTSDTNSWESIDKPKEPDTLEQELEDYALGLGTMPKAMARVKETETEPKVPPLARNSEERYNDPEHPIFDGFYDLLHPYFVRKTKERGYEVLCGETNPFKEHLLVTAQRIEERWRERVQRYDKLKREPVQPVPSIYPLPLEYVTYCQDRQELILERMNKECLEGWNEQCQNCNVAAIEVYVKSYIENTYHKASCSTRDARCIVKFAFSANIPLWNILHKIDPIDYVHNGMSNTILLAILKGWYKNELGEEGTLVTPIERPFDLSILPIYTELRHGMPENMTMEYDENTTNPDVIPLQASVNTSD